MIGAAGRSRAHEGTGWHAAIVRGGGRVIRPSLAIVLDPGEGEDRRVHIGTTYEIRIGSFRCSIPAPGYRPLDANADRATMAELARLLESPDRLRETTSQRLMTLLERADEALDEGSAPDPTCDARGLSPNEAARLRPLVHESIERRLDLLGDNASELHAWLTSVIPSPSISRVGER